MKEYKISNLFELEKIIEEAKIKLKEMNPLPASNKDSILFRGQANSNWKLQTTLERFVDKKYSIRSYNNLLKRIYPAIKSYMNKSFELTDFTDEDNLLFFYPPNYEFMTFIRHHGFPSPLLDWTNSLYVALFFAYSTCNEKNDVAIYSYIDTINSSKSYIGSEAVCNKLGEYVSTHKRHFLQQAQYTIAIKKEDNISKYCSYEEIEKKNNLRQEIVNKYILPGKLKNKILNKLFEMNINSFSLFSSDESLMDMLAYKEISILNNFLDKT